MDLSLQHLWGAMGVPAKLVVVVMTALLFYSVYIGIERTLLFTKARKQSRALAAAIGKPLGEKDVAAALAVARSDAYKVAYLGAVLKGGLTEFANRMDHHGVEAVKRAIERTSLQEIASLRKGMNVLATTGSTTPFVGLVGTIFGIINAFSVMSSVGGGDLTAISGGIAEALVSTAVGITVAIIAIWIYNYFNAVIDEISKDMSTSAAELIDWCEKEVLRRSEGHAAK
jgi:biopolymer transport protein ExbB/TolQ